MSDRLARAMARMQAPAQALGQATLPPQASQQARTVLSQGQGYAQQMQRKYPNLPPGYVNATPEMGIKAGTPGTHFADGKILRHSGIKPPTAPPAFSMQSDGSTSFRRESDPLSWTSTRDPSQNIFRSTYGAGPQGDQSYLRDLMSVHGRARENIFYNSGDPEGEKWFSETYAPGTLSNSEARGQLNDQEVRSIVNQAQQMGMGPDQIANTYNSIFGGTYSGSDVVKFLEEKFPNMFSDVISGYRP